LNTYTDKILRIEGNENGGKPGRIIQWVEDCFL